MWCAYRCVLAYFLFSSISFFNKEIPFNTASIFDIDSCSMQYSMSSISDSAILNESLLSLGLLVGLPIFLFLIKHLFLFLPFLIQYAILKLDKVYGQVAHLELLGRFDYFIKSSIFLIVSGFTLSSFNI